LGWDLIELEKSGMLFILEAGINPQAVVSGDFSLKGLFAILEGKSKAMGAKLIVIDALDVLLRLFNDVARERNEIAMLQNWLYEHQLTTILTAKATSEPGIANRYDFLEFMTDCVIALDLRVLNQVITRRIRIIKYRGSDFASNEYPFVIGKNGINIIPQSREGLQHKPLGEKMPSGNAKLDAMLDGGFRRNSSILISGTAGAGKTTLACTIAAASCKRGEKTLYISFEESSETILNTMLSPGIDLRPAVNANTLMLLTAMPESMGVESHLVRIFNTIDEFRPEYLVLEAVSACERLGSRQVAFDFLVRLIDYCKERGITTILTNQTAGFQNVSEISGIGLSSLIDAVIFLRYIESGGELNRLLLVMKSRGSNHSNQYQEFRITHTGLEIADTYIGEGGVLTGVARLGQEAKDAAEQRRQGARIKLREEELEELKREQSVALAESGIRGRLRGTEGPLPA
jgi:circadian clock protein KaiC